MAQDPPGRAKSLASASLGLARGLLFTCSTSRMSTFPTFSGLEIRGPMHPRYDEVLTPEAGAFVAGLVEKFGLRRAELLARRVERQREIDSGRLPDFLPETASLRGGNWRVAPPPPDL